MHILSFLGGGNNPNPSIDSPPLIHHNGYCFSPCVENQTISKSSAILGQGHAKCLLMSSDWPVILVMRPLQDHYIIFRRERILYTIYDWCKTGNMIERLKHPTCMYAFLFCAAAPPYMSFCWLFTAISYLSGETQHRKLTLQSIRL